MNNEINKMPDLEKEKEFHNRLAQNIEIDNIIKSIKESVSDEFGIAKYCPHYSSFRKLISSNLTGLEGKKVLVYGCGSDNSPYWFAKRGAEVDAFDIAEKMIEINMVVKKSLDMDVNFFVADAHDTKLPSDNYDIVFGEAVLHHLNLPVAAKEISRILKPGGLGFFRDVQQGNAGLKLFRAFTPSARTPDETPLTEKSISIFRNEFSDLEVLRFCLVEQPYIFLLRMLNIISSKLGLKKTFNRNRIVIVFSEKADQVLFRLFPFLRSQAWLVALVLRK